VPYALVLSGVTASAADASDGPTPAVVASDFAALVDSVCNSTT
jgi:hypothetical protein